MPNKKIKQLEIKGELYDVGGIELATSTEIGGIRANAQDINIDTQPVTIGADGKLYTKPSGTGPQGKTLEIIDLRP